MAPDDRHGATAGRGAAPTMLPRHLAGIALPGHLTIECLVPQLASLCCTARRIACVVAALPGRTWPMARPLAACGFCVSTHPGIDHLRGPECHPLRAAHVAGAHDAVRVGFVRLEGDRKRGPAPACCGADRRPPVDRRVAGPPVSAGLPNMHSGKATICICDSCTNKGFIRGRHAIKMSAELPERYA